MLNKDHSSNEEHKKETNENTQKKVEVNAQSNKVATKPEGTSKPETQKTSKPRNAAKSLKSAISNEKEELKLLKNVNLQSLGAYAFFIVNILIAVVLIVGIAVPSFNKQKDIKAKIEMNEKKLQKVRRHSEYLEGLYKLRDQLEENIALAETSITVEPEIPYVLNQLIQIANVSGVEMSGLSFSGKKEPDKTGYGAVVAQMNVSGSYDAILSLLKNLENSRRILTIDGIRLSSDSDGVYKTGLTITSYYMEPTDTSNISIEKMVSKPRLESVIVKLKDMDYYESKYLDIPIGTDNPFVNEKNRDQGSEGSENAE